MLYHLFEWLDKYYDFPGAGLFRYVSFRAASAIVLSLVIALIFGRRIIAHLRKLQVGEPVRDLGLDGQKQKQGTPTMGGIIIILAIVVPTLLFCRLDNVYIQLLLLATVWMGAVGFVDPRVGGGFAGQCGFFPWCRIPAFTLIELGQFDRECVVDLGGPFGEQLKQLGRDTRDFGLPCDDLTERHPEPFGQLRAEHGLVEAAERALIPFQHPGVQRQPTPIHGLDFGGDHQMGVQLRVIGAARRLTEPGDQQTLGVRMQP